MPKVNFEIRLADLNAEVFALTVTDAPNLSPELARRSFPISKKAVERLVPPDLSSAINSKDDALRGPGSLAAQSIEAFGEALFDLLIWDHEDPDLIAGWKGFVGLSSHIRSLRLCLTNKLPGLPWEALRELYALNGSLSRQFSVVRYVPTSPSLQPLDMGGDPLRMLVVFADPDRDLSGAPAGQKAGAAMDGDLSGPSAIQKEWTAIKEALRTAEERGDLCIDVIEPGEESTLKQLEDKVAHHSYHILHYFGHGHSAGQGQLSFEGARRGETVFVSWEDLQDVLRPTLASLRLVILNACELARPGEGMGRYTPFPDLAACFLNAEAAMVVAMQYPIRAETAVTFTRRFYEHLGAHLFASAQDVESAVLEGRKAIIGTGNAVEWITPVVFTRMQSDPIFRFPEQRLRFYTETGQEQERAGALLREARALRVQERWVDAARKVKEILVQDPGCEEGQRFEEELLLKAIALIERLDPAGGEIVDALA